ncbi:MAG: hypothetical protein FWG74_06395 [Planctomycetes bacterium]|nr:hypothetical protein [Planctomycetota bacterium]
MPASSVDYWVSSDNQAVTTVNDCGIVSFALGNPRIRRVFMSDREPGDVLGLAVRLRSGDEIEVPVGGRLEWITGKNTIAVLGHDSRVKIEGLRYFTDADGVQVSRLDLRLVKGDIRLQVRFNQNLPEAVMVGLEGADALIVRGDVVLMGGGAWFGATIFGGGVQARLKQGNAAGAPFTVPERMSISPSGEGKLGDAALFEIMGRLPFSFELTTVALPPLPALGADIEAQGP